MWLNEEMASSNNVFTYIQELNGLNCTWRLVRSLSVHSNCYFLFYFLFLFLLLLSSIFTCWLLLESEIPSSPQLLMSVHTNFRVTSTSNIIFLHCTQPL